jgi:hypothetical protein
VNQFEYPLNSIHEAKVLYSCTYRVVYYPGT